MKFPISMLKDFVQTDLNAEQVGDLLTMAGFELEGIEEVNGEPVLDIKVMSNRGDGLSVYGLSREVLAKHESAKATDLYRTAADRFGMARGEPNERLVSIETTDCTRYACRIFRNVRNGSSPAWIQERLVKAGMRPISLLVDLTNYVMLELGQPLHAFDFDKLRGGRIIVRKAKPGEKMTTLDGEERELTPEMMMICDAERPVAIAGVMGGADSEVSDRTSTVLLESAHFLSTSVRKTRNALGMSTEASYRFERSVDPYGVLSAIERFTQLLGDVTVGETVDEYPVPWKAPTIRLRLSRANSLLGMEVTAQQATRYLTNLGFGVLADGPDSFRITPPSWRPDVVREEDLIEEVGRVHGYDRIPETLPKGSTTMGGVHGYLAWKDKVREGAVRLGFTQSISHTLRDLHPLDNPTLARIGPRAVSDPDMMWLRNSVWPSLSDAARRNGGKDLRLFEIGQIFGRRDGEIVERTSIGFLIQGPPLAENWARKGIQPSSFFTLKGLLADLLDRTIEGALFRPPDSGDPRLHPTRQAEILAGGEVIGVAGQIDPDVAVATGLPADALLAEIDVERAFNHGLLEVHAKPISKNPAVRPDIAFFIKKSVPFEKIASAIVEASGELLEKHWLFDVYEGKGVPEGQHSLAVALQLRKMGANLTDEEASQVRERVVEALSQLGATAR